MHHKAPGETVYMERYSIHCPTVTDRVILPLLTYCGLGNASHRHSEAQQGVVLILG